MTGETILVIDDSPTIVRVVQIVLTKAGYRVECADNGAAGLEKARLVRPALILLDFVMPNMNGYQFCQEINRDDNLRNIPIILVSAKGDEVGDRFVSVMGIVDYITKPFSPEALLAIVHHTVDKHGQSIAPPSPPPQKNGQFFPTSKADPDVSSSQRPHPALQGDLHFFPIAEILQLLADQRQSGLLTVQRANTTPTTQSPDNTLIGREIPSSSVDGARVEIYFDKGQVNLALAPNIAHEYLLGRFIIETERMTQQDFDGFLASRPPGSKLIGKQLIQLRYISIEDLQIALRRQTSELIYEILRWNFGKFTFVRLQHTPEIALEASLSLGVEEILMEGFRRVDEWHLIGREIVDLESIFLRNEDAIAQMGKERLTREELATLELVNGKHTIKDIVRRSRLGSFEVSKVIYRLLSIKLIRRKVFPIAV